MVEIFHSDPPPTFERNGPEQSASRIGDGEIGGKAAGLMSARSLLERHRGASEDPDVEIDVPRFTVLTTEVFDAFVARGDLAGIADAGWTDARVAHAFQRHDLPFQFVGDLRALVERMHAPIAVRSSSRLEDRLAHPFAGVYETKMIPNDEADPDIRFQRLIEAIKFIYASMHFRGARTYLRAIGGAPAEEKMGVVLQEVVGARHGDRFYPHVSGVAKSFNYYAFGRARPQDGVVSLALGLGKTIVDGGACWSYCPPHPRVPPPFASARDQWTLTQTRFWAVNMGKPPAFDPISETEYLEQHELSAADYDGVLARVASSYDAPSDRMLPGVRAGMSPVVNFAPLLRPDDLGFPERVRSLLEACRSDFGADVEIEFALTFATPAAPRARLGVLQVRPMAGTGERIDLPPETPAGYRALTGSDRAMGNGVVDDLLDVVYVRPDRFELKHSRAAAGEIETLNRKLLDQNRTYLLIGFGRWGSTDPWLGIPIEWSQICAARAVVEASIRDIRPEPSQGSHLFHNLTSFRVSYFSVASGDDAIDWRWLDGQPAESETGLVRHVRLARPLRVMVDGRTGRGVIYRTDEE